MRVIQVKSPAKVNLFLRVIRRRPDGYHDIETLFEKIDLCDALAIEAIRRNLRIRLITSSKEVPSGRGNLAYKAASLFLKRFKINYGLKIALEKRIPVSAGLGGGSSNAASVLLALARLFELDIGNGCLRDLASELGSDVSFFMQDAPFALARGRGDRLAPIFTKKALWHVLVYPGLHIASRDAYVWCDEARERPRRLTMRQLDDKILISQNSFFNELEYPVARRFGVITEIKEALKSLGVLNPIMSGSGSCVFGCFSNEEMAGEVARRLKARFPWKVYVARTFASSIFAV